MKLLPPVGNQMPELLPPVASVSEETFAPVACSEPVDDWTEDGSSGSWDDDLFSSPGINPASGLPMVGDSWIDVGGNVFGTDTMDSLSSSTFDSFGSDSFGSGSFGSDSFGSSDF